jgi:hypothetical protein
MFCAGVAGFLAVWQGTAVPRFDERDRALERRVIAIATTGFSLGMILLWPTLVVLSEFDVYTPPPAFDGALLAVAVQAGLFAVVYGWLQRFEEKAHDVTRGMNPTEAEPTTAARDIGCATESEGRIRTPPWR